MNIFYSLLNFTRRSTVITLTGLIVIGVVGFVGVNILQAASPNYIVNNEPQLRLDIPINPTQTTGIRFSQPKRGVDNIRFATTTGGIIRLRAQMSSSDWEDVYYSAILQNSNGTFTLTGTVIRDVCRTVALEIVGCGNGDSFQRGAIGELTIPAQLLNAKASTQGGNIFTASGAISFPLNGSGTLRFPYYTSEATRTAQIPNPQIGQQACVISTGLCYAYIGGTWVAYGTNSTPNTTEVVAGKVQAGTILQQITRTNTGSTAALLFPQLKNMTLTGGTSLYFGRIPLLSTDGKLSNTMYDRGQEIMLYPENGVASGPSSGLTGGIQFDGSASGMDSTSTTVTVSYTTLAKQNRYLVVGMQVYTTGDPVTAVTYGGQAMTRISFTDEPGGRNSYLYVLRNPPSGANNLVISRPSTTQVDYLIASYSGVDQTANSDTSKVGSGSSPVVNPTVQRANAWIVALGTKDNTAITAGANATIRTLVSNSPSGYNVLADNAGGTGGSLTLVGTSVNYHSVTISPAAPLTRTMDFDTTIREYTDFRTILPSNYLGTTMTAVLYWAAPSGGNGASVVWEVKGTVLADGQFVNPAFGSGRTVTDTHQTGALMITSATGPITLTGSSITAGKPLLIRVSRLVSEATDTMPVDAKLIGLKLSF